MLYLSKVNSQAATKVKTPKPAFQPVEGFKIVTTNAPDKDTSIFKQSFSHSVSSNSSLPPSSAYSPSESTHWREKAGCGGGRTRSGETPQVSTFQPWLQNNLDTPRQRPWNHQMLCSKHTLGVRHRSGHSQKLSGCKSC